MKKVILSVFSLIGTAVALHAQIVIVTPHPVIVPNIVVKVGPVVLNAPLPAPVVIVPRPVAVVKPAAVVVVPPVPMVHHVTVVRSVVVRPVPVVYRKTTVVRRY